MWKSPMQKHLIFLPGLFEEKNQSDVRISGRSGISEMISSTAIRLQAPGRSAVFGRESAANMCDRWMLNACLFSTKTGSEEGNSMRCGSDGWPLTQKR